MNDSSRFAAGVLSEPPHDAPAQPRPRSAVARVLRWFGRVAPPVVVFGCLLGVLAWGHHSEWTLPQFSVLTGDAAEAKDDWCDQHGVPDSQCVECKPELMPRPKP